MEKLILSILLTAGALVPATAQQPPAPDSAAPQGAIVVQGIRDQGKEIGRFVDALTDAPIGGQLSRFDWAVCPAAVGLGIAQDAAITRRIVQVAKAADIPIAKAGCRPNVLLLIAPGKSGLIRQLRHKYPSYFEGVSPSEYKRMVDSGEPASAWHVEGRLDADGIPLQRDVITGQERLERTDVPSRLRSVAHPHFIASVVVIDLNSLAGLNVTQVADYAAMRAFARTDPRRLEKSAASTILSAIDAPMDSAVPRSLTEWDLAYLKSLYSSRGGQAASIQRSEMKRIIRRDLDGVRPRRQ